MHAHPKSRRLGQFAAFVAGLLTAGFVHAAGPRPLDVRRLEAAGLRVLEGKHVRLVTDLPSSAAVDELPAVFDAAVPEWRAYFEAPAARVSDAQWLGFLVKDREKFEALGLLPSERPDFPTGYARGAEFWLVDQSSDYYRRHLLLHEGTHSFMHTMLGGAGAPWYMEGMAELLGTHQWQDGKLTLGVMPRHRDDVPMWGRIKLIRDAVAADAAWPISRVLEVDNSRALDVDAYAWCWALSALLDGHPQFQERFRMLRTHVADPRFTERFKQAFAEDGRDLATEWQAFIAALDYGYDVPRMALVHAEAAPVEIASRRSRIEANRGWQSAGWILRGGQTYRVSASGRYKLHRDGEAWPCEPGGVTVDYYDGRPVGALLGALLPVEGSAADGDASFSEPMVIGLETTITPQRDAELYVRVSDDTVRVAKNTGNLRVHIEDVGPKSSRSEAPTSNKD
jgi:hypothetical protein